MVLLAIRCENHLGERMSKIVAITGSYRKGGTVDTVVDTILASARENGAQTSKIDLSEKHLEFCTNCRECTQAPGDARGKCVQQDDLEAILSEIESADSLVLGAPVNYYNVTAVFRRFLERLVGYAYWPWGAFAPKVRTKVKSKRAVIVTSAAMPGMLIPVATGAPRALKLAAESVGAATVAKIYIGLSSGKEANVSPSTLAKAQRVGRILVSG